MNIHKVTGGGVGAFGNGDPSLPQVSHERCDLLSWVYSPWGVTS